MKANPLKAKLRRDEVVIGSSVTLADAAVVELMGIAGYDYCGIMIEHASLDYQTVENMIRAAESVGIPALVRVAQNDYSAILRVMEAGAQGVMVPHVGDRASAVQVVRAVKYEPDGFRGMNAMTRAARWRTIDFAQYVKAANEQSVIVVMVEDAEGIENLEEIASVDGVDVVLLGANDLARAYGVTAVENSPVVSDVIMKAAATVNRVGKAKLGLPIFHPAFYRGYHELAELGVRFISYSTDATTLVNSWRENLRKAVQS